MWDVIIVGAGPAGLSAGLWLGRCRREVLVCDSGEPRNRASRALHGFISRDGTPPAELVRLAREEVLRYPSVRLRGDKIISARRREGGFEVVMLDGRIERSRMLLLATGREDILPDLPDVAKFYGRGVYHCPYCDGWEHRDEPLVVYGSGVPAVEIALELLTWSDRITVQVEPGEQIPEEGRERLAAHGIQLSDTAVAALVGDDGGLLRGLRLADGTERPCTALFFCSTCPRQRSYLAALLGCAFDGDDSVICKEWAATDVPGLFVAGNVRGGLHLAIMAAAEGAEAGIAMNEALLEIQLHETLADSVR